VKPDNPEVVGAVERFALFMYERETGEHFFNFFLPGDPYTCSHSFVPKGTTKSWIVRSRRVHKQHWHDAEAVVLSYRGKKTLRFNVVLKGPEGDWETWALDVSLRTGKLSWKPLETKLATELKEALKVAQR
jgi:hypothetical protein